MTSQQEADYYKSKAETSMALGRRDPDYKIVAERFARQSKRWQEKADKEEKEKR